MNPNETTTSSADARVLNTIRSQQRWLKALTGIAFSFWLLTVVGGIAILVCYSIFIQPKERKLMQDMEMRHQALANGTNAPPITADQVMGIQTTMSWVIMKGVLIVTGCLLLLSLGTVLTLVLVVANRRVTLKQINYSLAQISEQLRQLQAKSTT
jgi:hypothetical protein